MSGMCRYSVVVFVACHKFETTKKKLSHLAFDHFSLVCNSMVSVEMFVLVLMMLITVVLILDVGCY